MNEIKNSLNKQTERYIFIDAIESLAIFFVVLYHTTLYSFDFIENNSIIYYILYGMRTILSTCVPLFFLVNGFLLFSKPFDLKKHIKKIFKIVVLTVFWSAVLMPVYLLISDEPFSFSFIIEKIMTLDTRWYINFFWYLGALVCIYIFFPALKMLFDYNRKAFLFLTGAFFVLTIGKTTLENAFTILGEVTGFRIDINQHFISMFNPLRGIYGYSFFYFCLGGILLDYQNKEFKISKSHRNIICVIFILLSCFLLFLLGVFYSKFVVDGIYDIVWSGYETFFTSVNVICIFSLFSENIKKRSRFLESISKNTLGIYFIHGLIIKLSAPYLLQIESMCNLPINILYATTVTVICLCICLLMRKIPALKKLI